MKKTIGIIGGMGPQATCDLYEKIIVLTPAQKDQDHIHTIIDSYPQIPDRTASILGEGENCLPYLIEAAKRLENAGANFIIVPCNSSHYYEDEIKKSINIPFLSILEVVAKKLKQNHSKKTAVLATKGTSSSKIYDKYLNSAGIKAVYPTQDQQKVISCLIYDYIKAGKNPLNTKIHKQISQLLSSLKALGCDSFILGCTELPIAFKQMNITGEEFVDSTYELAKAATNKALGN